MGRADYLALGDWNCVCYQCGRKRKASEMKRHWQGYWVCPEHWEPRQPQDFARAMPDVQTPPWVQPMPADSFVGFCTPNGMTGIAEYAVADCAIVEFLSTVFDPTIDPPACSALVVTGTVTIPFYDIQWYCESITVSGSLTIDGTIGVA